MPRPHIARPVLPSGARWAALPAIAVAVTLGISCASASEEAVDQLTRTALAAKADPKRGHAQFDRYCAQCHGAGGRADANHRIPVLAGQRPAYLVRQLANLSGDQRESVNMHRALSAAELREPQTWADVAAYLNGVPVPAHPQTGDGRDLGLGEATFHVECASCHYDDSRGDDEGLVPSLRNQHYSYLLSQIRRLSQLHRHNVDENIARLLRSLKPDEASAVADYLSRLPGRPQDPQPARDEPQ
jgi:cytochrome c553